MSITAYDILRSGSMIRVTATSSLSGTIYYHWYVDGSYVGMTILDSYWFQVMPGDQSRVVCQDTNSASYDPIANAPTMYPSRRTLCWIRSADTDVAYYRIEENQDSGGWSEVARVRHSEDQWEYRWTTARLDDLSDYEWRVTPYDRAGNAGTAVSLGAETIVRRPDAPLIAAAWDNGTAHVTISEAS